VTCREFTDFIHDYLAGELPPEQTALFERHLQRCPHCPEYFRQYQATIEAGRQAFAGDEADVPADVPEDLIRAILASRKPG
jgi:anti-sigma factor RsiW